MSQIVLVMYIHFTSLQMQLKFADHIMLLNAIYYYLPQECHETQDEVS